MHEVFAAGAILMVSVAAFAADPPGDARRQKDPVKPHVLVTISKETTTSPSRSAATDTRIMSHHSSADQPGRDAGK